MDLLGRVGRQVVNDGAPQARASPADYNKAMVRLAGAVDENAPAPRSTSNP